MKITKEFKVIIIISLCVLLVNLVLIGILFIPLISPQTTKIFTSNDRQILLGINITVNVILILSALFYVKFRKN